MVVSLTYQTTKKRRAMIRLKNYEYKGVETIFPVDKTGYSFTKTGIGKIRLNLKNEVVIHLNGTVLSDAGKAKITSTFITNKGNTFVSVALRNVMLK